MAQGVSHYIHIFLSTIAIIGSFLLFVICIASLVQMDINSHVGGPKFCEKTGPTGKPCKLAVPSWAESSSDRLRYTYCDCGTLPNHDAYDANPEIIHSPAYVAAWIGVWAAPVLFVLSLLWSIRTCTRNYCHTDLCGNEEKPKERSTA